MQFREKRVIVVRTSLVARARECFVLEKNERGSPMSATVDASHRLQRSGLILIILWGLIGDLTSNWRFDVKLVIRRQIVI